MKYRIKATKEIVELRTWRRDDGAIKLVDKYGKMGFWPDEVEPAEQLGWRPASELPVIPEGKFSVSVIAYCNTPSGIYAPVEIAYTRTRGWQYESVKWWCYPPKEN